MKTSRLLLAILALAAAASCQKAPDPFMQLSQKNLTVDAEGGDVYVKMASNVYYRVNNDMEWATIDISETQGDTTVYVLKVDSNADFKSRVGTVRFIGDGVTPLKLTLNQKGAVPLGVDPGEINVPYTATSTSFKVLGDKAWTATCDVPGFAFVPASGSGEDEIRVSFPENGTEEPVTANVTVTIAGKNYKCKIIQAGMPSKNHVDLSAPGKSNCYLITAPGYYKFDATACGNGVVPASQTISPKIAPASVKVLWTTFNTEAAPANDDALITELTLDGGEAKFRTADLVSLVKGNAVIAALDASGNILWSWHIWCADEFRGITCGADQWMDRSVGALAPSTYLTTDPQSMGMTYQWGRKDPFRPAKSFTEPGNEIPVGATGTWPKPILCDADHQGLEFSIRNPQQVLYAADANYNNKDWFWEVQYNDLWGAGAEASTKSFTIAKTVKTMFDPCPAGWCIPTSLQQANLASEFGLVKTAIGTYGIGNEQFWLVYQGGLTYNTGELGGPVGGYSWYAGSCTNGVNMLCTRSHTTACNFGGAGSGRTCTYTARCVKE